MSGVLALGAEPRPLAWNPLPTVPRTNAERFALSLEQTRATGNFFSEERNYARVYEDAAAALREAGVQAQNPYADFAGDVFDQALGFRIFAPGGRDRIEERKRAWDIAVGRLREDRPEEAERYLFSHEIEAMARRRAQEAYRQAALPEGLGGGLGAFLGGVVGVFSDPVQLMTLPLGAGRLAGGVLLQIAKTAAIEGAIAGATQAVVETRAGPYRQSLGLPDDTLEQIGYAAAGGAVIGGGLRALIAGVERALGRGGVPPAEMADASAAVAAARAEALVRAGNPAGPEAVAAHERAVAAGIRAIETPDAPPVPTLPPPVAPPPEAMRLVGLPEPELRAHVRSVVEDMLAARAGSRADGAWRPDLGAITIEWGDARAGLAHIIARRNAEGLDGEAFVRDVLPEVLTQGNIVRVYGPADGLRVDLEWNGNRAALSLFRNGTRENWILTGFPLRKGGPDGTGGLNPPPPYAPRPTGTGATEGAGPQFGRLPEAPRRFNVYTPTGRAVLVEPKVVELDRIIVSHDAEGRPNPAYPHKEGVQPRERGAAPSQAQVREIAAKLTPARLLPNVEASAGPPIVSNDLVAETGNGRVAALALVYRDPELAAQRAAYLETLQRAGYDTTGFREPVLVAERITPLTPAERAAFVREANKPLTAAETVAEQARNDAAAVAAALPRWRGGEVDAAANRDFVRAFVEGLTVGERSGLLDPKGEPTPRLIARIERAVMQAAYGDALAPVLERLWLGKDEGLRGLAAALRQVAGDWAALRADIAAGRVPAEYEATPALAEAVDAIAEAQARRIRLAELVDQVDIERPAMTAPARAMLSAWFPDGDLARRIKGQEKVAEVLRGYVERARLADAGPTLFDLPPLRPDDTLAALARAPGDAPTPARAEPQAAPAAAQRGTLQAMRGAWPERFPDVIAHGVQGIRRDPDWTAAKTGDAAAALRLVERLAKPEAAERLKAALAGQDATLVTVRQAERGGGDNLIPATFARWLAARTGLPVDESIYRLNRTMRTDADALQRLVRRAAFAGDVQPGRAYVIVDDVVTQGGTVADLRGYIEAKGGRVVAVTALQAPGANARLAPSAAEIAALRARFGEAGETWWKETFGHDFSGLTASESRQLFRFASGDELRSALEGLGTLRRGPDDAGGGPSDAGPVPGGGTRGGGVFPGPQGGAGRSQAGRRGLSEEPPPGLRAEPQAERLLAADDEARRLAVAPETERAELFEARRVLAERDVGLVVDDAGTTVSARALLEQAEREIEEAATAAAACLIGSVAA